jgi:hypothetical protein
VRTANEVFDNQGSKKHEVFGVKTDKKTTGTTIKGEIE